MKHIKQTSIHTQVHFIRVNISSQNAKNIIISQIFHRFSSVQFSHSVLSDSLQTHGPQHTRLPCLSTNSQSLLKLVSFQLVMPSNHLILCHPLLLPSVFPSIRVISSESVLHIRWPKYCSFSFSISPSNEYSGLISFRMGWWISLLSKRLSRVFSDITVQKRQFLHAQLYL